IMIIKLAIYATTRAQNGAPKRVLNDPREKGSSGKRPKRSRGSYSACSRCCALRWRANGAAQRKSQTIVALRCNLCVLRQAQDDRNFGNSRPSLRGPAVRPIGPAVRPVDPAGRPVDPAVRPVDPAVRGEPVEPRPSTTQAACPYPLSAPKAACAPLRYVQPPRTPRFSADPAR